MEKPTIVSAEKGTCIACGLVGSIISLVSFPCIPWYVAVAV